MPLHCSVSRSIVPALRSFTVPINVCKGMIYANLSVLTQNEKKNFVKV